MRMVGQLSCVCNRVTLMFLLAACVLSALRLPARAQQDVHRELLASPQYLSAVEQAVASYDGGRYVEAHEHFSRAHAIVPNARTLRGLGMVELELGRRVSAARHLEQALASTVLPLEGAMLGATEASLAAVRQQLARLQVTVEPPQAQATVRIAGNLIPQREAIVLEPGTYEVEVAAEGFAQKRETLGLSAGDDRLLSLQLEAPVAKLPPVSTRPAVDPGATTRHAPWYVVAGGAAVGITGAVLLGLAHRQQVAVREAPDPSEWSAYEDEARSYRRYRASGFTLMGLGIGGVASGLVWYSLSRRSSHVDVSVHLQGVRLSGSF